MLVDSDWEWLAISNEWHLVRPWYTSFVDSEIDAELMEFTWMRDRKWNMIFEWDICKILFSWYASKSEDDTRTLEEYLWDKAETFIIQFDTNWFYATRKIWWWSECMEHWKHWFIEVIGNIYENLELIK
jgi:uncharacterized phage protein (TIGR01671 family)